MDPDPGLLGGRLASEPKSTARIPHARNDKLAIHPRCARPDGRVAGYGEGDASSPAEDAAGDLVMPGLIELHTNHLEAHYIPRPKVFWNPIAAVISYDGQLATSGITTVLDSLRVWREDGAEEVDGRAERALKECLMRGTTHIRTHVEVDPVIGMRGFDASAIASSSWRCSP